jgi:hypothetical protein
VSSPQGNPEPPSGEPSGAPSGDPAEVQKEDRPASWLIRATLAGGAALTVLWAIFLVWAAWHTMSGW